MPRRRRAHRGFLLGDQSIGRYVAIDDFGRFHVATLQLEGNKSLYEIGNIFPLPAESVIPFTLENAQSDIRWTTEQEICPWEPLERRLTVGWLSKTEWLAVPRLEAFAMAVERPE